jgi:hypothetical protein
MQIQSLRPDQLHLNPDNDRHGSLRDEPAAIQWLLDHRSTHMRALAEDLASTKRLYEAPLVRLHDSLWIVFDGNRRMCCIKLLIDPELAPSSEWKNLFSEITSEEVVAAFGLIECEVETDLAIIDEMLYRRHTGTQDGVGRSQWDPEGKSFFLQRTGKGSVGLGQTIENALKSERLISDETALPWSNLERLFSSEPIRRRAGISFSGGSLVCLTNKQENLATLKRIADDMIAKTVVLGDLWNNASKSRYLDTLKSEGLAIDLAPAGKAVSPSTHDSIAKEVQPYKRRSGPRKDKHLISAADTNPFIHRPDMERAEKIWRELQHELEFEKHDNAIAVLMRVLLELSITQYAADHGVVFNASDAFAKRVSSVADSMLNRGLIDTKARSIIRKFQSDKPIVSAHSMHQYVHNASFHPSKSDLKAIWNVIRAVVINSTK